MSVKKIVPEDFIKSIKSDVSMQGCPHGLTAKFRDISSYVSAGVELNLSTFSNSSAELVVYSTAFCISHGIFERM